MVTVEEKKRTDPRYERQDLLVDEGEASQE